MPQQALCKLLFSPCLQGPVLSFPGMVASLLNMLGMVIDICRKKVISFLSYVNNFLYAKGVIRKTRQVKQPAESGLIKCFAAGVTACVAGKIAVFGLLERKGSVYTTVIPKAWTAFLSMSSRYRLSCASKKPGITSGLFCSASVLSFRQAAVWRIAL